MNMILEEYRTMEMCRGRRELRKSRLFKDNLMLF